MSPGILLKSRPSKITWLEKFVLTVLGISHKTAPLSMRERMSFIDDDLELALASLKKLGKDAEYLILSTCNRTEIYTTLDDMTVLLHWLGDYQEISVQDLSAYLYTHHGLDAISHLMHVASGLDSMVLGEPQILGQLKEAYARAKNLGCINFILDQALMATFNCAKAVRSKTSIGQCPVSIAFSAIRLSQNHADLSRAKIGILGAGKTAELLLKHLKDISKNIFIFNRTLEKSTALASQYQQTGLSLNQLSEYLPNLDLIISAVSSPDYLINVKMLEKHHQNKPLLLVDISVPRSIDPEIQTIKNKNIKLCSIDDIQAQIERNIISRTQASLEASELITAHMAEYQQVLNSKMAAPYIADYRAQSEQIRDLELAKAQCLLARGVDPMVILNSLAHHLTNKLIHRPTKNLHLAGTEGERDVLEFAQKIFKPLS